MPAATASSASKKRKSLSSTNTKNTLGVDKDDPNKRRKTLDAFFKPLVPVTSSSTPATTPSTSSSTSTSTSSPNSSTSSPPDASTSEIESKGSNRAERGSKSKKERATRGGQNIVLNEEQMGVLRMAVDEGKNVFFTGAAGESPSLSTCAYILIWPVP